MSILSEDMEALRGIGIYLKEKRVARNLTQKEVAKIFGYSTSQFVSNWERGVACPPMSAICKMIAIYQIPEDEIYHLLVNKIGCALKKKLVLREKTE